MPHWREMTESDWLRAFDLQGRDVTVTIEKVVPGEVTGEGGKKSKRPVVYFKGKNKPLALNATNCKTIARMFGNETNAWAGKAITLYPTVTQKGGEETPCLRVRPAAAKGNQE